MIDTQDFVREVRAEQLRRKRLARAQEAGQNLANSVADVAVAPDPQWETDLRAFNPITDKVSHLRFYWYRAGQRWVLYDCMPIGLIPNDDTKINPMMTGADFHAAVRGKPPRELSDAEESPISDVQHEFARRYRVYACPFWVLQGDAGGHQVRFSPWQQNVLIAKGLPSEPPTIGSLPACPFDQRVIRHLHHLNRLHKLGDRLDRLQASGSVEAANAEMDEIQREIRTAEMSFIESQMTPLVEMTSSLRSKSADQDQLVHLPGMASRATDAYQEYKDTGLFTLKY